jgi:hypothetical protein
METLKKTDMETLKKTDMETLKKTDMETLLAQLAEDGGDGDLPEIVMTDGS